MNSPIGLKTAACAFSIALLSAVGQGQESATLNPGDEIVITVFGQDDLTTNTTISASGKIEFPQIGTVQLGARTVAEAVAELTGKLSGIYSDPKVSLTVTGYSASQATVAGSVKKPGLIDLPADGKLNLLAAIATAGGFGEQANPSRVAVRRMEEGKSRVFRLDARDLATDDSADPFFIQPGDVITVAEQINETVTVMGAIRNPGLIEIPAGEPQDILRVIAQAGSFSEDADPSRVQVTRWTNGKKSVHQVDVESLINDARATSFPVGARDIVTVPVRVVEHITVMGEVNNPGVIPLPPDGEFNLLDAIASAGGYTQIANSKKIVVRRAGGEEEARVFRIDARKLATDAQAKPFIVHPNDTIVVPESLF